MFKHTGPLLASTLFALVALTAPAASQAPAATYVAPAEPWGFRWNMTIAEATSRCSALGGRPTTDRRTFLRCGAGRDSFGALLEDPISGSVRGIVTLQHERGVPKSIGWRTRGSATEVARAYDAMRRVARVGQTCLPDEALAQGDGGEAIATTTCDGVVIQAAVNSGEEGDLTELSVELPKRTP